MRTKMTANRRRLIRRRRRRFTFICISTSSSTNPHQCFLQTTTIRSSGEGTDFRERTTHVACAASCPSLDSSSSATAACVFTIDDGIDFLAQPISQWTALLFRSEYYRHRQCHCRVLAVSLRRFSPGGCTVGARAHIHACKHAHTPAFIVRSPGIVDGCGRQQPK